MSFVPTKELSFASFFGSQRQIQNIPVQCVISEETTDTLTITKQPVQTGASITDHSYIEPTVLSMRLLQQAGILNSISSFSNFTGGGLSQIYQQFLTLQSSQTPFPVVTPKRTYNNMLIASLRCTTDKTTENILALDISFQQVFFVNVGSTVTSGAVLANPASNLGNQSTGMGSLLSQSLGGQVYNPPLPAGVVK